jgi:hypothetical protein
MVMCDAFVEFGIDVLARGTAEIGMHLHAWNSPPLQPLTNDDFQHQPYLIEYPAAVMKEKIRTMTALLEDRFSRPMVSHRAGRWAFDGRYASMLLDLGYRVDCSVTPGIDWSGTPGAPDGRGGSDYTDFPHHPYFLSPAEIAVPASAGLLEVPMTVHLGALYRQAPWAYRVPVVRWGAKKIASPPRWLCPTPFCEKHNFQAMLQMARRKRAVGASHMEFMLHSSELMPGGSPAYRNASDIDRLYEYLEVLFDELSAWCRGVTLEQLHAEMRRIPAAGLARSEVGRHAPPVPA